MKDLNVIVVGAGIGGISTALALATSGSGHKIVVLDAIKEFAEVGAGIRVSPNSSKLAKEWGVDFDSIEKETSLGNRFVSWKNELLCEVPFGDVEEKYGAPYYFIHRADLVNALRAAASKYPEQITIITDSRVVEYDFSRPAVRTERGQWYSGDLVISAEGIKSSVREAINGGPAEPADTGDVAYRILVPAAPLLEDPELRTLVTEPWATHWMGPEGHAVGYPLRGGKLFNIIVDITHRSDCGEPVGDDWKKSADNRELIERFKDGWCYPVQKLCGMTGEYVKWKLAELERPLQRWVHPSGKVALLGDACHAMMPYLAQGAAQVLEDAATLSTALTQCSQVSDALELYEKCRASRTDYVVRNTQVLQEWLHLYDGQAQQQRDKLMTLDTEENPIFWANKTRRDWLFGHDARKLDECDIPNLPPLPPAEASVYPDKDLRKKLASYTRYKE